MITALMPVTEAALFTLGCIAIHALQRHAETVTATLACFATLLVLLVGLVYAPIPYAQMQTTSLGDFVIANPALY